MVASSPVSVQYSLSALGRSLPKPFRALYRWTIEHLAEVEAARERYEIRTAEGVPSRATWTGRASVFEPDEGPSKDSGQRR